jgi:hypothetical protein
MSPVMGDGKGEDGEEARQLHNVVGIQHSEERRSGWAG